MFIDTLKRYQLKLRCMFDPAVSARFTPLAGEHSYAVLEPVSLELALSGSDQAIDATVFQVSRSELRLCVARELPKRSLVLVRFEHCTIFGEVSHCYPAAGRGFEARLHIGQVNWKNIARVKIPHQDSVAAAEIGQQAIEADYH